MFLYLTGVMNNNKYDLLNMFLYLTGVMKNNKYDLLNMFFVPDWCNVRQ